VLFGFAGCGFMACWQRNRDIPRDPLFGRYQGKNGRAPDNPFR
jgi:hypothetical protein